MNILFFYSEAINPLKGGVERVTSTLADYLRSKGHIVLFISHHLTIDEYNKSLQFFLPNKKDLFSKENIEFYKSFLFERKIDIVINQCGLFDFYSRFVLIAEDNNVKTISVIHNSILAPILHFKDVFRNFFEKRKCLFLLNVMSSPLIMPLLSKLYLIKKRRQYKYLLQHGSYVALLSDSYKKEMKVVLGEIYNRYENKIVFFLNPIKNPPIVDFNKEKRLLYVGRVNCSQKRTDILIKIWEKIFSSFKEWNLDIVGNGEDLNSLKDYCICNKIERVNFLGFQEPEIYYKRSSIFCMTSSFEGLPMTILEAQSYGVVPVAFDSFLTASEIINNGVNGILISPFIVNEYIKKIGELMSNPRTISLYSASAIKKAKQFDISVIGKQWDLFFNTI